jgi:hypothetical protein
VSSTAKLWLLNLSLGPLFALWVLYPLVGVVGSLGVIWWGWRHER